MRKRDIQLVLRLLALLLVATVAALGVLIVVQSQELEKVVSPSPLRTALVVLAPLASLALINYSMVARSIGRGSLAVELLLLAGISCIYLGIVLSVLNGVVVPATECLFYDWFCDPMEVRRPDWHIGVMFAVAALVLIFGALVRAGILRSATRQTDTSA